MSLPNTLTPADLILTPGTQALITDSIQAWGRLFPTLECLSAYDLEKPTFKVGKSPECDCVLTKTTFIDKKLDNISREQFVISRQPGKPVHITDLSKNGTFVNGDRIGKKNTHILQNDDEISIGFQGLKVFVYKNLESHIDTFLPPCLQVKYYVSRFLGKGACGEVRLIFDKRTCRPYAMKKIIKARSSQIFGLNHVNSIKKEIAILTSLKHDFIVSVINVEEVIDTFFITMEYMEGGQLTDLIESKRLTEEQVKYFFHQIIIAVSYLHDNGIIHRDLKSDNILLKEKDNYNTIIKVSDFGLSKMLEEESLLNTRCGTPYYIAPEIIDPTRHNYDRKVDIWSLGVLLYYMLSQKLPFCAADTKVLNKLILNRKFNMDGPLWANISKGAKNLINSMLTVSPEFRINLEEIPDHGWIDNDYRAKRKIADLMYGLNATYSLELEETLVAQDTRRMRYSLDDD